MSPWLSFCKQKSKTYLGMGIFWGGGHYGEQFKMFTKVTMASVMAICQYKQPGNGAKRNCRVSGLIIVSGFGLMGKDFPLVTN
jgi:hypothetical protein